MSKPKRTRAGDERSCKKRGHVGAHDRMRADKRQSRETGQRIASAGNATDDPNRAGMRPETKRASDAWLNSKPSVV